MKHIIKVLISFGHGVLVEFYTTADKYLVIRNQIAKKQRRINEDEFVTLAINGVEYDVNPDFVQLQRVEPVTVIPDRHFREIEKYGSSLIRFVEGGGIYVKQSEA